MKYDVIVVGGGVGGLSTAALLVESGRNVLLLEKRNMLGGRAASFEYKPGWIVDWGIHMCRYGEGGEAAKTLRRLGVELDFESPGMGYYFYEDGELHGGLNGWSKVLSLSAIRPMLSFLLKVGDDVDDLLDVSLKDWVSHHTNSEEVKQLFWMLSSTLLISPFDKFDASLGELIRTLRRMVSAREGGAYPVGGWKTIIEKLTDVIEEGGEIRTKAEVDEVIVEDGTAQGVKVGEEIIEANYVVLGVRHQMIDEVIKTEYLPPEYLQKCKSLRPTAGISFDIGTSSVVSDVNGLILSRQVPLLGAVTSNIDSSVAPEGKQLMTFFFAHTPEEMEDKEFVNKKIEEYREIIHEMLPDLEENVEWERVIRMKCVDGSALTTDQHYKERPGVETPIENLYFASDTCGVAGGGGDISFKAARKCVDLMD